VAGDGFIGTLEIDGNYTQGAGGTLCLDISGRRPGQFDVLNVLGVAAFAGTLQVNAINGYAPPPRLPFVMINYVAEVGAFAVVNSNILPAPPPPIYGPKFMTFVA